MLAFLAKPTSLKNEISTTTRQCLNDPVSFFEPVGMHNVVKYIEKANRVVPRKLA